MAEHVGAGRSALSAHLGARDLYRVCLTTEMRACTCCTCRDFWELTVLMDDGDFLRIYDISDGQVTYQNLSHLLYLWASPISTTTPISSDK